MQESTLLLITISRGVFFLSNILLDYSFLTSKRPRWFQILAFAGAWVAAYFLRGLLSPLITDPFLVGYLASLLFLIPFALVFEESVHAKLFIFFMVYSLSQLNFLICLFLELLVFNHMVGGLILVGLLLELFSIPFIRRYVTPHIKNILEVIDQQNPSFTFFPILSFVFLAYYGVQRIYLPSTFIPLVFCTLLIAFTYYLIAISIDHTKRHQQLEKQLALQRDHYRNLNDSITAAKATRHDLRHHLATLLEFVGKKDAAAAQEYLTRLCNVYDDSSIPTVCRNQAADALICHYIKLARQQGIALVTRLNVPDNPGIKDVDLCVIIGNCLENAMDACNKVSNSESRVINLNATVTKGYLVIQIANSFSGLVSYLEDGSLSSEKGEGHGIGLASVKTLADKYQGHCLISQCQQMFNVTVSLKLPEIVAA
ncbi:MAG: sensor histidine kinase [Negativicutes bacterium]